MRSGLPWLSVLTCPTRPQYLEQTIAAIDAAGGDRFPGTKVVCVDGDPSDLSHLLSLKLHERHWAIGPAHHKLDTKGPARSMLSILDAAAADDAPGLLYFEDDVIMCENAVEVMARMTVPSDCWALQFCDLKHIGPRVRWSATAWQWRNLITRHETDHHWGNQALRIPRATLDRAAATSIEIMADHPSGKGSDVLLGRIGKTPATPFLGVVAPSIVQHIGAESICNPNRDLSEYGRSAHNFPGVDFDARSLLGGE